MRKKSQAGKSVPKGSVRIIGGRWRGRRLAVAASGIRPTPDRVRETLFNWLMPTVAGARCLDACAGTGVLGLEALSRGAEESWLIERDGQTADALERAIATLSANARVIRADAVEWLAKPGAHRFDVAFLDPPYEAGTLGKLCTLLDRGWLMPRAWVYLETARGNDFPDWPDGWRLHREAEAGDVRFALACIEKE